MYTPTISVEPRRRINRAAVLLAGVFVVGAVGFYVIGGPETTVIDAIYMNAITLTTVGYGEVVDVSASDAGKIFTTVLLLGGVGTFLYFFSSVTAFIVEGTLDHVFWRRKMERTIARLSDHVIVCGGGNTGEHIVAELVQTGRPFVLVECDAERVTALYQRLGAEFPSVVGDATEDETLRAAGIERAGGLVTCISSDKDNLVVTFSARELNPHLRIVSRSTDARVDAKLARAGADSVVSPNRVGGLRMVSEMIRPKVVNFLDVMLRDRDTHLRFEEAVVAPGSALAGTTMRALAAREIPDLLVIATHDPDGSFTYNPDPAHELVAGRAVVFIGSPAARRALEDLGASSAS